MILDVVFLGLCGVFLTVFVFYVLRTTEKEEEFVEEDFLPEEKSVSVSEKIVLDLEETSFDYFRGYVSGMTDANLNVLGIKSPARGRQLSPDFLEDFVYNIVRKNKILGDKAFHKSQEVLLRQLQQKN